MRQGPVILAIVVGTACLLVGAVMGVSYFSLSDDDLCGNTEVRRLTSPDGLHDAMLFERNCGATTDFSSQVSVVLRGAPIDRQSGNALIADTDHGAASAGAWGGPLVEMDWLGNGRLQLRYSRAARVFARPATAGGVRVVYSPSLAEPPSANTSR